MGKRTAILFWGLAGVVGFGISAPGFPQVSNGAGTLALGNGGGASLSEGGILILNGAVSNGGGLTKAGQGTLTLKNGGVTTGLPNTGALKLNDNLKTHKKSKTTLPTYGIKGKTPGQQTAVVVGPPGEEIITDKHGRVKVTYPWIDNGTGKSKGKSKSFSAANSPQIQMTQTLPSMKQASSASATAPVHGQNNKFGTVQKAGFAGTGSGTPPKMEQAKSASATAPVYNQNHLGETVQKANLAGALQNGTGTHGLKKGKKTTKSLPQMKQAGSSAVTATIYSQNNKAAINQKAGFVGTGTGTLPKMKQADSSSATAPVYK